MADGDAILMLLTGWQVLHTAERRPVEIDSCYWRRDSLLTSQESKRQIKSHECSVHRALCLSVRWHVVTSSRKNRGAYYGGPQRPYSAVSLPTLLYCEHMQQLNTARSERALTARPLTAIPSLCEFAHT